MSASTSPRDCRPFPALRAPRPLSRPRARAFAARSANALLLANLRYWSTVAPTVRAELRRWEERARAIEDPDLRSLALHKLDAEGFHAEAGAMLATLAPRRLRKDVVQAIVALQVLFDYLDGVTERPSSDPVADGLGLFQAYSEAVALRPSTHRDPASLEDGGYLDTLSEYACAALHRLPAAPAVRGVAFSYAARSAQAQVRVHAANQIGTEQLEQWARREASGTGLDWREFTAGAASSVLGLHALMAAAADPATTPDLAAQIAATYLIMAVPLTLLDGLVDHDHKPDAPQDSPLSFISLFAHPDEVSDVLSSTTQQALARIRLLVDAPHHTMTLLGVVAYETSNPSARVEPLASTVNRLHRELPLLIYPALVFMRTWRLAKRIRNRRETSIGGLT